MIPKNQKTATSTNQQARITSKHELTSVQSSCIPTNQHHEPRTRIPASTKQQSPTKDTDTSKHQAAITYQGHGYQQAPSRHVSPASTNSPAFKVAAYLPTSSKHQAAITYQGHGYQPAPSSNHLPRTRTNQQPAPSRHVSPASTNSPAFKVAAYLPTSTTNQGHGYQQAPSSNHLPRTRTSRHEPTSVQSSCIPTNQQPAPSRHVSPASTNLPTIKNITY